nr:gustatory receptor 24 [Papilio machaon]
MNKHQHSAIDSVGACIVQSMRNLLYMEYVYGIFRCRLGGRSSDAIDLRLKLTSVAVSSIWLTIYFYGINPYVGQIFKDVISTLECMSLTMTAVPYAGSIILLVFWHAEKNRKVIEMFAGIDISLHAEINQNFYNKSLIECKKLLILYLLVCGFFIAMYIYFFIKTHVIENMTNLIAYLEIKIEIIVFCHLLYMVKQRLLLINNYLNKITLNETRTVFVHNSERYMDVNFIGHISNNNYKIRDLVFLYCKLGKLFSLINNIFNYLMFTSLASSFSLIILYTWSSLYVSKLIKNYLLSLPTMFTILIELLFVIIFAYYCENIMAARNKITNSLHKIINNNNIPSPMRKQAEVFLDLIKVWPMSIYIYDMFEVNFTLVLKFISISTTYIIVVIQVNNLI